LLSPTPWPLTKEVLPVIHIRELLVLFAKTERAQGQWIYMNGLGKSLDVSFLNGVSLKLRLYFKQKSFVRVPGLWGSSCLKEVVAVPS